ncbi:MAG: nitroreductase family protein [Prevotella sp.]
MRRIIYTMLALMAYTSCQAQETVTTPRQGDSEAVERVIMSRRSIRKYTGERISRETLSEILRCGINAPNGQNKQAYEIRVIDDSALLKEISDAATEGNERMKTRTGTGSIFAGAPCVVFIAHDTTYGISQIDCGLLGENIILAAWAKGIGTCCMAFPVRLMKDSKACEPYMRRLGFSEGYDLIYCITMGYPDETPQAKPRKEEKIVFVEK